MSEQKMGPTQFKAEVEKLKAEGRRAFRLERIEGQVAVPLAVWLFFAWELGRWRMRRKYPLEKPTQQS